jgi:ribonucleoside-diphosphate reductase alpha chain
MFGEPEYLVGYGRRNVTLNAIAPTTSSAFILGQVSQSIEPIWSNCYVKDMAKMKVTVNNQCSKKLLQDLVKIPKMYGKVLKNKMDLFNI